MSDIDAPIWIRNRTAARIASAAGKKLFTGRHGHGNGPCSRRVLAPEDLREILDAVARIAFDAGTRIGLNPDVAGGDQ